jgi:hypothetical protein
LGGDQCASQVQRHLRVVGDLAGPEPQPAATDHGAQRAVGMADFGGGHELDRRAQRVADGEAEIGAKRAFAQFHSVLTLTR